MDAATCKGPWHDPPAGRGSSRAAAHPIPESPPRTSVSRSALSPAAVHVPPSGTRAAGTHGGLPPLGLSLRVPRSVPHPRASSSRPHLAVPPLSPLSRIFSDIRTSFLPTPSVLGWGRLHLGLSQHSVEQDIRTGDSKDSKGMLRPRLTKQGDGFAGHLWLPTVTTLLCLPQRCPRGVGSRCHHSAGAAERPPQQEDVSPRMILVGPRLQGEPRGGSRSPSEPAERCRERSSYLLWDGGEMLRVEWAVLVGGMFAAPGPSAGRAAHGVTAGFKLLLSYRS